MTTATAESTETTTVVNEELEAYKAKVRAEALRIKQQQGYCDEGFNETMRNLDLPELKLFRVPVKLVTRATSALSVEVREAQTEEEARSLITTDYLRGLGYQVDEFEIPTPKDVNDPTLERGDYGNPSQVFGRNQCDTRFRTRERTAWYCTRPRSHRDSKSTFHVAAGSDGQIIGVEVKA